MRIDVARDVARTVDGAPAYVVAMQLHGIPETLVMPLWARAAETAEPHGLVRDTRAADILGELDYDFSKFDGDWRLQLKVAIRTILLDRAVADFVARRPDALVVNIGAGLDARFSRVDNGRIRWVDLDVPETIALRRRFFTDHERWRMLERSVFDLQWLDEVDSGGAPALLIAEGVLQYFSEERVRALVEALARALPGTEMLIETTTRRVIARNHRDVRDKFKEAKLHWGIKRGSELEAWKGVELIAEWGVGSYCRPRWRGWWWWATFPPFASRWHNRVVHLRFAA